MIRGAVVSLVALVCASAACAPQPWPAPPAIDPAAYQKTYAEWHDEQQHVGDILAMVGIWPLPEGETPFGSDKTLPIVLPASAAPDRAGVFQRTGDSITIVPAPQSSVHRDDGTPVTAPTKYADGMTVGSVLLVMEVLPDGRHFVAGIDQAHPAMKQPPRVDAFPPDQRWRVAAACGTRSRRASVAWACSQAFFALRSAASGGLALR